MIHAPRFWRRGSKKSVGGKQMIQLEERYGAEFIDIDYSGITDIVDVVAC